MPKQVSNLNTLDITDSASCAVLCGLGDSIDWEGDQSLILGWVANLIFLSIIWYLIKYLMKYYKI